MYVFSGSINRGSIESLKIGEGHEWQIIHEHSEMSRRSKLAAVVLNCENIAVFGGFNNSKLNDGFVFDPERKSVDSILGDKNDIKFTCTQRVQEVSRNCFVTVGLDDDFNVHMVHLKVKYGELGRRFELSSIKNYLKDDDCPF